MRHILSLLSLAICLCLITTTISIPVHLNLTSRIGIDSDIQNVPEGLLKLGEVLIARTISQAVISRLYSRAFNTQQKRQEGPILVPIPLPPLPDPLNLPGFEILLNLPIPGFEVSGHLSVCEPKVIGLSLLEDDLIVGYDLLNKTATIDLSLKLPSASIHSIYQTEVLIQLTPPEQVLITGEGALSTGFNNFFLDLKAEGQVPLTSGERLSLDKLDIDFGFEGLYLTTEELELNGQPANLTAIVDIINLVVSLWPTVKDGVNEMVRCSLDHAVNDCPPLELISGVIDCLKLELKAECFGQGGETVMGQIDSLRPTEVSQGIGFCQGDEPSSTPDATSVDPVDPSSTPDATSVEPSSTPAATSVATSTSAATSSTPAPSPSTSVDPTTSPVSNGPDPSPSPSSTNSPPTGTTPNTNATPSIHPSLFGILFTAIFANIIINLV